MYYLIGRAFQNQSVFLRAFPGACRSSAAIFVNNNNVPGFSFSNTTTTTTIVARRDFNKWTRPTVDPHPVSKASSLTALISKRQSSSGDHVTLWTAERVLSGILVPLLPITFLMPCAPLEAALAFVLTLHSHWGIEAIVVDYVRPSVFGNVIPKVSLAAVYGLTALTLGGLLYFIYADVGLVTAIKMLWKL